MTNILDIENLSKSFGGLRAVNDLSLAVSSGEIMGMIGPNGAGKTTCFNLITGFDTPDTGQINFSNRSIRGLKPHEICHLGITRTFQQAKPLFGLTILENVAVGGLNRLRRISEARKHAKEVIGFLGLEPYTNVLAENLPIGFRKVLEIAKCLATRPKLLLLDEVMAGLNPSEMEMILVKIKDIQKKGITVLLIEHVMEAVTSVCDRIVVLNYGEKISEGSPTTVMKDQAVIDAYLGDEMVG